MALWTRETADDRAALRSRIGWERRGIRLLRLAAALFLLGSGVAMLVGLIDGSRWSGALSAALGASLLWDRARDDQRAQPSALSVPQRDALQITLSSEGRLAAVQQFRRWTGASYADAASTIDAAFPDE